MEDPETASTVELRPTQLLPDIANELQNFAESENLNLLLDDPCEYVKTMLSEQNYELSTTETIVSHLESADSDTQLSCIQCVYWLLQTGLLETHDYRIVESCINVCRKSVDFNVLYFAMKISNHYEKTESCPPLKDIFLNRKHRALVVFFEVLKVSKFPKEDKPQSDFIFGKLNHWFIWTQNRLRSPLRPIEARTMMEFFIELYLDENRVGRNNEMFVRNIITYLLNLVSKSRQRKYVAQLVTRISSHNTSDNSETTELARLMELIYMTACRGKCDIVRQSQHGKIATELRSMILSPDQKEMVVKPALNLLTLLYEGPQYLAEHAVFKTEEFLAFLVENMENYDQCQHILTFFLINDSKSEAIRQKLSSGVGNLAEDDGNELYRILRCRDDLRDFKHKCQTTDIWTVSTHIVLFVLSIIYETISDMVVSVTGLLSGEATVVSGILLFICLFRLPICNFLSLRHFYKHGPLSVAASLEGNIPANPIQKYVFPWRFDSFRHWIMNLLTLCQFNPTVLVIDLIFHVPQPLENVLMGDYHISRLKMVETMVQGIPCLAITLVLIYIDLEDGSYQWDVLGAIKLPRLAVSVGLLAWSLVTFESKTRIVNRGLHHIKTTSQKVTLFLGYLTMISSRILTLLLLFSITRHHMWKLVATLGVHAGITLVSHLLTYTPLRTGKDTIIEEHYVFLREFPISILALLFSELFFILLRHPIEIIGGSFPYYEYERSGTFYFAVLTLHAAEVVAVAVAVMLSDSVAPVFLALSWVAIGLYLVSIVLFVMYRRCFHPDVMFTSDDIADDMDSRLCIRNEPRNDWKSRAFRAIRHIPQYRSRDVS